MPANAALRQCIRNCEAVAAGERPLCLELVNPVFIRVCLMDVERRRAACIRDCRSRFGYK